MDNINNIDSNKYVISLDSLDLGLLPVYTKFNNDTASLWSTKLYSKDYFEFQVKDKTEPDVPNDVDSSIDNDNTKPDNENQSSLSTPIQDTEIACHMCDINIPAAYVTEHENSLKHKAYIKIADIVLSRTRKHMVKKNNSFVQRNYSTYFCGPCASEVEVINKKSHEKSKAHKQSVSLDRLLFELIMLLTDVNDNEEFSTVLNKTFDDVKLSKSEELSEVQNDIVVISDIGTRLQELKIDTTDNYVKMVDEFISDKPYSLSSENNNVKITMENGCEVTVTEDNFNGFIQIDENSLFCILCKIIVEERISHKNSIAHIKNITTPFKDHHCIRNLENSLSHCVICNKIIHNTNLHVLCHKAPGILEKTVISEINENKPDDENKADNQVESISTVQNGCGINLNHIDVCTTKPNVTTKSNAFTKIDNEICLCTVCNIKLHVNNVESHKNGSKHAMLSKSNVHFYMTQSTESNLMCRACKVHVSDDVNEIKIHIETSEHVRKYRELLKNNHVIRQRDDFYCKLCDVVILKRNELFHIEKLSHEVKVINFIEKSVKLNNDQDTNANYVDSNTAHAIGNKSIVNTDANNLSNDSKVMEISTAYFCKICQVKVPNNPHNINSHNDGSKHKKNVLKAKEELDTIENNSTDEESLDIHYQMDAAEYEANLLCKVCEVVVPNKDDSIEEHVKGKKHDAAFKTIMAANNIEYIGDNYFCKDCNIKITLKKFFEHINQAKHQLLINLRKVDVKPVANKEIQTSNSQANDKYTKDKQVANNTTDNNKDKESMDKLYLEFKHHFTESEDKQWLNCRICFDMQVPNIAVSVANHCDRKAHRDGYDKLMSDNLIFKTEDTVYYCAICDCLVPFKGEVHHAKGMKHTGNHKNMLEASPEHITDVLKNQTLLFYCEYCKALISKDKTVEHRENCHRFAVKDKICFCTQCDPYLPGTSKKKV